MTRRIITITIIYFVLAVGTFSSCNLQYDATICDITFTGLNSTYRTDTQQPDRFIDKIGFEIRSVRNYQTCYTPNFQFVNSANAMTTCARFQNELLKSTYELSFDRAVVLNTDTIAPNTNILANQAVLALTDIEIYVDCKWVTSTIVFRQELIDQITFESGEYMVDFKCATNDGKTFLKTRQVVFEE